MTNEDELRELGAVATYRRLKFQFDREITLNALWALDAALSGTDWRHLGEARKAELKALLDESLVTPVDRTGRIVLSCLFVLLPFIVYGVFYSMVSFRVALIVFGSAVRGAGDTRFSLWFTVVTAWLLMVLPTVWIVQRGGNLYHCWAACTGFILVLGIFVSISLLALDPAIENIVLRGFQAAILVVVFWGFLRIVDLISDILFDQKIGAGCVKQVIAAWVGNVMMGSDYTFRREVESGRVAVTNMTNFAVAMVLHAAAMGVQFLPARSALGIDVARDNEFFAEIEISFQKRN